MAVVMIGVDPHKASHTAVAIGAAEEPLGQLRVRAGAAQAERLPAAGDISTNDRIDARSVAVAAWRSADVREAWADDHAAVLKVWSTRYRDLSRARTQVACPAAPGAGRADSRRRPPGDHRGPGRADPGIDHLGRCGGGCPL